MPREFQSGARNSWYERTWGSKWAIKAGGWHGKQSSEDLQHAWAMTIEAGGMRGVIGNDTTYGPYVQGADDQSAALERIGWKTTEDVAKEEQQTVNDFIVDHIDKALSK